MSKRNPQRREAKKPKTKVKQGKFRCTKCHRMKQRTRDDNGIIESTICADCAKAELW